MYNNKIFNLKKFSPVAFKLINYPNKICLICRDDLNNLCSECKNLKKCKIIEIDNLYYHEHCYKYIQKNNLNKIEN